MDPSGKDRIIGLQADNDEKTFDLMVELYGARLYRFVRSMTADHAEAHDIMQETFLKTRGNTGGRGQEENACAWLHKTAYNLCLNSSRREKRRSRIEKKYFESGSALAGGGGNAETEFLMKERAETVRRAVMRLPEKQRTAIALFNWSGMKIAEIAEVMACSEGTVMSHLHRARASLKEQLEEIL
jgi:RNA polymerase sigma-70 factor (ECF subfamily)